MNYLERYRNGEHEQVWKELQDLAEDVRNEAYFTQAQEVANDTMRRVRRNCERIISRLNSFGYIFGTYPDGTRRSPTLKPHTLPSDEMLADSEELKTEAGQLPISLTSFWQEVGAIDLVGMHPSWSDGLDQLVIDPPEGALSFLYDEGDGIIVGLAPDDFHKDNVSGGDPYSLQLPNPSADFVLKYERHNLFFVPYFRLAILGWGGFPGLEGSGIQFEPLESLTSELEIF